MASLIRRLRDLFGGTDDRVPEPIVDGQTYLPLAPFETRLAAWRNETVDRRRRAIFDRVAQSVDREKLAALQGKYRNEALANDQRHTTKYLDLAPWFSYHSRIAMLLDIDRRAPSTILDIGAGGGHFAAIAKAYGHKVTTLDLPDHAIYGDLIELFGLDRVEGGVFLGQPLPAEIDRYDLIVINGQVFDTLPATRERWDLPEWASFIEYLTAEHLAFPGQLFIGLNRSAVTGEGRDYLWPLVDLAARHDALVDRDRATMLFSLDCPPDISEIPHRPWLELQQATAQR